MRPERILSELRKAVPEDGFIVTDVGWNKNGVGQQFPITVPGHVHHAERAGDDGVRAGGGAGRQDGAAGSRGGRARSATAASAATRRSSRPRWRPGSAVVWLVMDNAAFGTIAGLTNDALRLGVRLPVRAPTASRYRADFAQMAQGLRRATACSSTSADELGPALTAALASGLPTVIQAPMENAPTPTPGHWDINDIYRKGS